MQGYFSFDLINMGCVTHIRA